MNFFSAFEGLRQASECGPPPGVMCMLELQDFALGSDMILTQCMVLLSPSKLQFLAVHQHMHIKYRLHISVYLHTSALIILDE